MSYNTILTNVDKNIFKNMINQTHTCMMKKGKDRTFEQDLNCETAYLSSNNDYTYHTHPNGNPEPSEQDRKTTNKLQKDWMFIGLVPTRTVVVYSKKDNFQRMYGKFRV